MDTDLVKRAQGGDQEAFADLVYAIADRFLAVSHRILSDIDLAEDATQQALLSIWQDLPQLRDPARFEAWSCRLLVHACYAEGRKSRRWAPNMRLLSVDEPMTVDGTSAVVDRDQLERAFRRLSLNHRTVVVLHHYLDLPLERVADIVGAPRGTVGSRFALRDAAAALGAHRRRTADGPEGGSMTDFTTSDRDVNRAIRSWLREDRHEDASRIAGAVLDQVEATPERRATWWPARRRPTMNKIAGIGLAAAAVVAVVLIGAQLIGSPANVGGPGVEPTPTPTAEPTPEPTPSPSAEGGLPEGPFMILDPENNFRLSLTVTIPAPDWDGEVGGGELVKNDIHEPPSGAGMIIFVKQEYIVYGDACHWETTVPDSPATTVDELVAALSAQASRDASEPVDITLGGYAGKSITLEVPDDVDFSECDPGYGGSWDCGDDGMTPCGYHSGAGEIDTVYILDVDGVIIAWNTKYYPGTPAEDVAELEAIVQSASFGE